MSKRGKAPYVPEETLENVLMSCYKTRHDLRDRALMLVSHYLGLRAKELAALKLEDVLDHNGQLREIIKLKKTKGDRVREVFLVHEPTRQALQAYLSTRSDRSRLDAPVFRSQKGGAFSAGSMQRQCARIYQRSDVKASSHSGRRSFATRLIERNADIYAVKELLGHEDIRTTQEYFFTSPERLKRVAELLNR